MFWTLVLGIILVIFGIVPFVVPFPNNNPLNSGPANFCELLIYLAYDGKTWLLPTGIILLLIGLFSLYKFNQ